MARQVTPQARATFWVATLFGIAAVTLVLFLLSFQSALYSPGARDIILPVPPGAAPTPPPATSAATPGGNALTRTNSADSADSADLMRRGIPDGTRQQIYFDMGRAMAVAAGAAHRAGPRKPDESREEAARRMRVRASAEAKEMADIMRRYKSVGLREADLATIRAEGIANGWPTPTPVGRNPEEGTR